MKQVIEIPLIHLLISLLPLLIIGIIFYRWKLDWKNLFYATLRMLSQLLIIGYFLTSIFNQSKIEVTILILLFMLLISSWISLFSIRENRKDNLLNAFISLLFGALPILLLVVIFVIPSMSWYSPSFIIPIAGMVFSNSMNTISLSAERFRKESKDNPYLKAKQIALSAALIPQINSFMAVGLVALPGMMTGQILSGISPLIAVRYQIVVMSMVLGGGGISAAIFLHLSHLKKIKEDK